MPLKNQFTMVPAPGRLVLKCPGCGKERSVPDPGVGPGLSQRAWFPCARHCEEAGKPRGWKFCDADGKPFGTARKAGVVFTLQPGPAQMVLKCPECGTERARPAHTPLEEGARAWWPCRESEACYTAAGKPLFFDYES